MRTTFQPSALRGVLSTVLISLILVSTLLFALPIAPAHATGPAVVTSVNSNTCNAVSSAITCQIFATRGDILIAFWGCTRATAGGCGFALATVSGNSLRVWNLTGTNVATGANQFPCGTASGDCRVQAYKADASGTGTVTFTFNSPQSENLYVVLYDVSGAVGFVSQSGFGRNQSTNENPSINVNGQSYVPKAGSITLAAVAQSGGVGAWAAGTNYTLISGQPSSATAGFEMASEYWTNTQGTVTAPFTLGNNGGWVEYAVSLWPVGGPCTEGAYQVEHGYIGNGQFTGCPTAWVLMIQTQNVTSYNTVSYIVDDNLVDTWKFIASTHIQQGATFYNEEVWYVTRNHDMQYFSNDGPTFVVKTLTGGYSFTSNAIVRIFHDISLFKPIESFIAASALNSTVGWTSPTNSTTNITPDTNCLGFGNPTQCVTIAAGLYASDCLTTSQTSGYQLSGGFSNPNAKGALCPLSSPDFGTTLWSAAMQTAACGACGATVQWGTNGGFVALPAQVVFVNVNPDTFIAPSVVTATTTTTRVSTSTTSFNAINAPNTTNLNWLLLFLFLMLPLALMAWILLKFKEMPTGFLIFASLIGLILGTLLGSQSGVVPLGVVALFVFVLALYLWKSHGRPSEMA